MADSVYGLTGGATQALTRLIAKDRQTVPDTGRPSGRVWDSIVGDGSDPNSACCGPCVDDAVLTIDSLYADAYTASRIPIELGGPIVTLNYVGLLAVSPLTSITHSNVYYWESNKFEYTCDAGPDQYIWRMIVDADGTSLCRADYRLTVLYLINVGSATHCTDLSTPRCDPGSLAGQFVQYQNSTDWRARCGSKLYIKFPQFQQTEIEALLNCQVCVAPVDPSTEPPGGTAYADLNVCWKSILDTMGRTELPGSLWIHFAAMASAQDGNSEDYLKLPFTIPRRLDFDISDMKYHSVEETTAPDCAGSGTDPDNFRRVAKVNRLSELFVGVSPALKLPFAYFEISCLTSTTIQVKVFAGEDWEFSNNGSSHACSATKTLTISADLSGNFTFYLHAERSPINVMAGHFDWSLAET